MLIIIHAFLSSLLHSIKGKRIETSLLSRNSAKMGSTLRHIITYDANDLREEEMVRTLWDTKWKKQLVILKAQSQTGVTIWEVVGHVSSLVPVQPYCFGHAGSGAS